MSPRPSSSPRPCRKPHRGALEVIDAAGHEILAVQAHADSLLTGGEDKVSVKDVLGLHAGLRGQDLFQVSALAAEDGLQIDLRVILHAVVQVAAEVDAEVGDAGQRTVGADQTTLDAALGAHQQTACHGQWTVEPGGHDHAAVALDLGLGEDLVLRVELLDTPGGRVAVAGGCVPAGQLTLGHTPCQHGRAVAGGVILAAGGQLPRGALRAVHIALGFQNGGRSSRGVESTDAGVQKTEKLLYRKSCILHGYFLLGILTIHVPFIIARCAGKVNPAPLHGPLKFVRDKAD